jgi:hypothetical protein
MARTTLTACGCSARLMRLDQFSATATVALPVSAVP